MARTPRAKSSDARARKDALPAYALFSTDSFQFRQFPFFEFFASISFHFRH